MSTKSGVVVVSVALWVSVLVWLPDPPAHAGNRSPVPQVLGVSVTASSTLAATRKLDYEPWRSLAEGGSQWCEGKRDEGIGESLVVTLAEPAVIASLTLRGGVWRSLALFRANNIVTGVDVISDDGRTWQVGLPEEQSEVEVALGGAPIRALTIKLTRVKKGRMNDSCLSAVRIHTVDKATIVLADRDAAHELVPAFGRIREAIESCEPAALRAHVVVPMGFAEVGDNETMRSRKYKDAAAVIKACKAGQFGSFVAHPGSFEVVPRSPTQVTVHDDVLEWQLARDAFRWKLAGLVDNTP